LPEKKYKYYKSTFTSNNQLYKYLCRDNCQRSKDTAPEALAIITTRSSAAKSRDKLPNIYSTCLYKPVNRYSTAKLGGQQKPSACIKVVESTVNTKADMGTGYRFRNWYYITTAIKLRPDKESIQVCLDTGYLLLLIDRAWLKSAFLTAKIYIIVILITVCSIGKNKYASAEYIVLPMFFEGKIHNRKKKAFAKIIQKVYLVDNLQTKILIRVDIIGPEKINIFTSKQIVYIGSCRIDIDIYTRPRSCQPIKAKVRAQKDIAIALYSTVSIPVYFNIKMEDLCNLLFEPGNNMISFYTYIVDRTVTKIVGYNTTDCKICICKNMYLRHVTDVDFDRYYKVPRDLYPLALQMPNPDTLYAYNLPEGYTYTFKESKYNSSTTIYSNNTTTSRLAKVLDSFPESL
jgi:hypothetical protein